MYGHVTGIIIPRIFQRIIIPRIHQQILLPYLDMTKKRNDNYMHVEHSFFNMFWLFRNQNTITKL